MLGTDPSVNTNSLVLGCVRVFKFLFADNAEEVRVNIRAMLEREYKNTCLGSLSLAQLSSHDQAVAKSQGLQRLFGANVVTDALLRVFNGSLSVRCHFTSQGEPEVTVGQAYNILEAHLLQVQEKPTPTRFWVFAFSVFCLARWSLLEVCLPEMSASQFPVLARPLVCLLTLL